MKSNVKQKIVIIGCGNLAWHLAKHLFALQKFQVHVYNHRPNKSLTKFKTKLNFTTRNNFANIISDADYYFICVDDKFISAVSQKINADKPSSVVVHTSGSISIGELNNKNINNAVFYPLQTFSVKDEVEWAGVPIIIEGNNGFSVKKIKKIALLFSKKVFQLNSLERLKLHLAAVIVNNFTNALYTAADNFLKKEMQNKLTSFKLLLPLINQTGLKLKKISPANAQTGPAKRKDKVVIKQHLKILNDEDLKRLYKQLSTLISKQ